MDTHEIAKLQRIEEQLHKVTPEGFYEPCSVLQLKVNGEEKVLATSEDEQHWKDFGGREKVNIDIEGFRYWLDCTM